MPVAAVRELQSKRFLLPKEALARGLIDKVAPFGSMKESITEVIDKEIEWVEPKPHTRTSEMSFFEFMSVVMAGPKPSTSRMKEPSIVVLHLSGAIQDGKQASPGSIVEGPMVAEIKKLTDDDRVHGVVVRINSPGGSATASESIRQALKNWPTRNQPLFRWAKWPLPEDFGLVASVFRSMPSRLPSPVRSAFSRLS